jgi:hypothetical protein
LDDPKLPSVPGDDDLCPSTGELHMRSVPPIFRGFRFFSVSFAAFCAGCVGGGSSDESEASAMWQEALPPFTRHEIPFEGGYYATSFDVDLDGLRDIVALSTSQSALVWFKNPSWDRYDITTATSRFIHTAPYDIDADGDLDLAIASEFNLGDSNNGGLVHWAENPDDPTMTDEWTLREIDQVPTSHRLRWGDLDGDGTSELLNLPIIGIGATAPEYVGPAQLKAYWIPLDPTGPWDAQVLDDSRLEVAHGITVVDWDGDETADILTASNDGVLLFRLGLGGAPEHIGAGLDAGRPNRGSSEVALGTLGGDRFVASIDPWHGTDAVVYTPPEQPDAAVWDREVIGTAFTGGHGLDAADLNGDGYDEIVGGGRGGGGTLMIYRYRPDSDGWEEIALDVGGVAASSVEVHDINGDGRPDILAMGGATDNVVWYENTP